MWAKTDEGIRGFLVPGDAPGFSAPEQKHKWSLRASVTSELVLEDVRLPGDAILPGTTGLKSALLCLTAARYGIAWGAMGAAMACFDEVLSYSKERVVFGKPLAGFQIPQQKLANTATEITLGQLPLAPGRAAQGRRALHAADGLDGQAQQRPQGPRDLARLPRHARRQRRQPRVPDGAPHG